MSRTRDLYRSLPSENLTFSDISSANLALIIKEADDAERTVQALKEHFLQLSMILADLTSSKLGAKDVNALTAPILANLQKMDLATAGYCRGITEVYLRIGALLKSSD